MILELSEEAAEFGRGARKALGAAGGDALAQLAEEDSTRREQLVAPVLNELGAWDLDPRGDALELEAAAALCRNAGYWATPYPVAERLSRPLDLDADGLIVVADGFPAAPIHGLDLRWVAVSMSGHRSRATPRSTSTSLRNDAFVVPLDLSDIDDDGGQDLALGLLLPCWTLLGMLDRAVDLTRSHVLMREQFGRPLAQFQGVQFQLTDAEVERSGVEVLAKYALWSVQVGNEEALHDVLAARLAAVEAAQKVFRVAHQLHGATGFCDETTLSWLSRYSLPLRRLPFGQSATNDELTRLAGRGGLTGLFSAVGAPAAS
ncbi:acyl-CoA dehydrogenase family protein [Rhodococcus sp. P1Y]|uniref:acyl-CoA dehydrogenase family protein n=1 Tax=Rhodococcus sp. P1Y TaxID=1302308 RepID=UPI000EB34CBA|nr:acyl-CoA dehydrogenase family protein [Rhodococcus sp. P1Y]AYJ50364.1 acyl-CoA dehydrogenase [Rhodococcus sp. P1Y]